MKKINLIYSIVGIIFGGAILGFGIATSAGVATIVLGAILLATSITCLTLTLTGIFKDKETSALKTEIANLNMQLINVKEKLIVSENANIRLAAEVDSLTAKNAKLTAKTAAVKSANKTTKPVVKPATKTTKVTKK